MNRLLLTLFAVCSVFVGRLRIQFCTANATETSTGTHPGAISRRADAAWANTHLLVKKGTDAGHVNIAGASDYPVGICSDSPDAAEDIVNVMPLGASTQGTRKARCATALNDEIDLYTAANGLVQAEPGGAGTYWKVGRSVAVAQQVGTNDYLIEFAPQMPVKLTVAATPSTVGNIAAAMTTGPGLVKFL